MSLLRALCVLCLLVSPLAQAWNAAGHAAVAAIAQQALSPRASAEVARLLAGDLDRHGRVSGRRNLAEIASWPDEIRDEAVKTDPKAYRGWHVRANPVCGDTLAPCPDGHCVDLLIEHFTVLLGDVKQPQRVRNEALKWVVHLLGDEHMPLHAGVNANGGRARVQMPGVALKPGFSLHEAWDGPLLDHALAGWVRTPRTVPRVALPADAPTRWMIESRAVALHEVYEPLAGFSCEGRLAEPLLLDAAYRARSVAVIRLQIERAGERLAQLLNATLDP